MIAEHTFMNDLRRESSTENHYTHTTVPVLLLIQMRDSEQTADVFPTATVRGTCHCKLQRESDVSNGQWNWIGFYWLSYQIERHYREKRERWSAMIS